MTPEELTEARETIGSDCQESDLVCAIQEAGQSLLAHIDQQAKQIESLKEKLVEERARRICHVPTDSVGHWSRYEDIVVAEARQQLAQEMPEVDWQ